MSISFPNIEFPGTHDAPIPEPTELHASRTHFAGLNGEVELILGRGGLNITIPIVVHGTGLTTAASVVSLLNTYARSVGFHGELQIGGTVQRTFKNCTFLGFTKQSSVLPDVAKTLNSGATGYFVRGVLTFRQLSAEENG